MPETITVISPCHNENITVIKFLDLLQNTLQTLPYHFHVVVVDDYSTDNTISLLKAYEFTAANIELHIIRLRFNVGHQGAIYQGLVFAQQIDCRHFIVMDSDGEDSPLAIPELLAHLDYDIVHVVRGKRQESLSFKLSYWVYKGIFKAITGNQMNFGNYSLFNRRILETALYNNFHHFAAFLSKQKGSRQYIVYARDKRIDGKSKMNFKSLVHHAFKSLVEYGEDLLMIFLKFFMLIMILFVVSISNILYQKFWAHTAILGWASTTAIGLLNMAIISIGFFILGILLVNLNNKRNIYNNQSIFEEIKPAEKK